MLLANFNGKEHLRHRAVSLRQHGFLVILPVRNELCYHTTCPQGAVLPLVGRQVFFHQRQDCERERRRSAKWGDVSGLHASHQIAHSSPHSAGRREDSTWNCIHRNSLQTHRHTWQHTQTHRQTDTNTCKQTCQWGPPITENTVTSESSVPAAEINLSEWVKILHKNYPIPNCQTNHC